MLRRYLFCVYTYKSLITRGRIGRSSLTFVVSHLIKEYFLTTFNIALCLTPDYLIQRDTLQSNASLFISPNCRLFVVTAGNM